MTDLRTGIIATANALGMNPADLATIISYETGGTFDPRAKGPRTQWGQHEGLIQFGEPQAAQFGVDWNNPIDSQLGPDGAIAKYYRAHGWQPGMGMLDAYSIVNAGAPGRYNASDAGNGGAPGTVADKVNGQMAGHREKAIALLGGAPLSFGNAVPQMGDPTLAGLFDPRLMSMGEPVVDAPVARQQKRQDQRQEQEYTRRAALADLIRF